MVEVDRLRPGGGCGHRFTLPWNEPIQADDIDVRAAGPSRRTHALAASEYVNLLCSFMGWDFGTDEDFEQQLAWMRDFVREEVAALEVLWPNHHHRVPPPWLKKVIDPLKQQVKTRGLWACHLGPELAARASVRSSSRS